MPLHSSVIVTSSMTVSILSRCMAVISECCSGELLFLTAVSEVLTWLVLSVVLAVMILVILRLLMMSALVWTYFVLLVLFVCPIIGIDLLASRDLLILRFLVCCSCVLVVICLFLLISSRLLCMILCVGTLSVLLVCSMCVCGVVSECKVLSVCLSWSLRMIASLIASSVKVLSSVFLVRLLTVVQMRVVMISSRNTGLCSILLSICYGLCCGGLGSVPGLLCVRCWCVLVGLSFLLLGDGGVAGGTVGTITAW